MNFGKNRRNQKLIDISKMVLRVAEELMGRACWRQRDFAGERPFQRGE